MIRVTKTFESPAQVTLKVEGQLASDCVPVLERECLSLTQGSQKILLDLEDVTFIDSRGVKMLKGIRAESLEIINCSDLIHDCLKC